jgi:hypothetical protein
MEDDSDSIAKHDLGNALNGVKLPARTSHRKSAVEKSMAKTFLEVANIYGKEGRVLLERCQSSIRDTWATEAGAEIKATKFEDYLLQRIRNFSVPYVYYSVNISI